MAYADPQTIIIGHGVLNKVVELVMDYAHPLVVSDRLVYSKYGSGIDELLGTKDQWVMVDQFEMGRTPIRANTDIIVGFGGGRSIDTAKLIARDLGLQWISVPTAASHDGIASNVASVTHNGYRYSERCKSPIAVVGDLSIINEAPPILKQSGIGDILSKASSLWEWKLAHETKGEKFDDEIFLFVEKALNAVIHDGSLEVLIRALIDSGKAMSAFGSSRPCSGTEHAISHAMDREQYTLHGLQVAFATPLCVAYLSKAGVGRYNVGEVIAIMQKHNLPHTMKEIGLTIESFLDNIHHALRIMERRERYSILEHLNVSDGDLRDTIIELGY